MPTAITKIVPSHLDGLNTLVTSVTEYLQFREHEVTRRAEISADRDVRLAIIKQQAKTVQLMIDKTFSERTKNFETFFSMLESGVSNNNEMQINAALTMIVEQTKNSPMAQSALLIDSINNPKIDSIEL